MGPSALGPLSHLGQVAHTGSLTAGTVAACMLVDSVNDNCIQMSEKMLQCVSASPLHLCKMNLHNDLYRLFSTSYNLQ